jgi:hypothetical protein
VTDQATGSQPPCGRMSPAQACENYAIAWATVNRLSEELGDPEYADCTKRDHETGDCIDRLFHCPRGPDYERPRYQEFFDALCPRCKARLATLDERKAAKAKLGAAKRTVLTVGRRLLSEGFMKLTSYSTDK